MTRRDGLAGILVALAVAGPATADLTKPYAVQAIKDIPYYEGPGQHKFKHKLDLYLPQGLRDFPVLFFVHGGGWVHGDKNTFGLYGLFASSFAKKGIGVVVTNYRLSPEVKHPEHIKDVARAFAWCHKNIAKHGGRADCLFVCGHSAGGHLVALLACDETYLKEHGLSSKAIRGVIPISGLFILRDGALPHVFGDEKGNGKKISPIAHVRKGMPPFLILYADNDLPSCNRVPGEAFCRALKKMENTAEVVEIQDSDHFRILLAAGNSKEKTHAAIVDFIRANSAK